MIILIFLIKNLKDEKNGQIALQKALELDPTLSDDMEEKYPYIKDQVAKEKSKKKQNNPGRFSGFFIGNISPKTRKTPAFCRGYWPKDKRKAIPQQRLKR